MQKLIKQMLMEGNGVIKASEARLAGVNNKELQRLTESGELERISHGLYIDAEHMEDEYFITQYRCRKGVYSYETALFFHNLSDRTPLRLMMTIPNELTNSFFIPCPVSAAKPFLTGILYLPIVFLG